MILIKNRMTYEDVEAVRDEVLSWREPNSQSFELKLFHLDDVVTASALNDFLSCVEKQVCTLQLRQVTEESLSLFFTFDQVSPSSLVRRFMFPKHFTLSCGSDEMTHLWAAGMIRCLNDNRLKAHTTFDLSRGLLSGRKLDVLMNVLNWATLPMNLTLKLSTDRTLEWSQINYRYLGIRAQRDWHGLTLIVNKVTVLHQGGVPIEHASTRYRFSKLMRTPFFSALPIIDEENHFPMLSKTKSNLSELSVKSEESEIIEQWSREMS